MGSEYEKQIEEQQTTAEDAVDESQAEQAQADSTEGDNASVDNERNAWEREKEELVNKFLRLQADFANYKRRNEESIEQIRLTANESLVFELLSVIDNFELAINSATEETSFVTGVKMIYQQLMDCLEKAGLQALNAVGKPFDPNFHAAVINEGDTNGELIVTAELKKGYLFKGKLLRESMVKVGSKQQEEDEE